MSQEPAIFNAAKARAKRPCPIWVDAFHRDTQHLSADEIGGYFLMLMAMWSRESCDLPDDDMRLAKVCRVSRRLWTARIGPALRPFFQVDGGALVSKRLRLEAAYVEKFCQMQHHRKAGKYKESDPYALPEGTQLHAEESGEKSANHLKDIEPPKSAEVTRIPLRILPTQQPNNPTEEEKEEPVGSSQKPGVTEFCLEADEEPPPKQKRRKPLVALPQGWVPSDRNVEYAREKTLSDQEINHEADKFRHYYTSTGKNFRDWDSVWSGWVLRYLEKRPARPMAGPAVASRGGQSSSLASIAARRRASGEV